MRRRKAPKRQIQADPKYKSTVVGQLINIIMQDGKKTKAQGMVYGALDLIGEKMKEDSLKVFFAALENARPRLEVRPRRIGGATYQVPMEVTQERGISTALRWIRDCARSKKGRAMETKIADEVLSAFKNEGSVIKKKEDMHKMAEANKAFAHFKW